LVQKCKLGDAEGDLWRLDVKSKKIFEVLFCWALLYLFFFVVIRGGLMYIRTGNVVKGPFQNRQEKNIVDFFGLGEVLKSCKGA